MILKLKDGTQWNVADTSTKTAFYIVENNYSSIDSLAEKFTAENLKGAILGEETLENIVPVSISTTQNIDEAVVITLNCREKTEIEILTEKINDTDNAVMELAEMIVGGEE